MRPGSASSVRPAKPGWRGSSSPSISRAQRGGHREVAVQIEIDSDENPRELLCTFWDHSALLDYDQAHLFQAALLTAQQHVSPDGIVIVSPDDELLFHNDRYAEIWDIPGEVMATGSMTEVRNLTAARVVQPDGVSYDDFQGDDHSHEVSRDELKLTDGRILLRHGAPIFADDGVLLGRYWSYRDVTQHRSLQWRSNDQATRLSALVDHNPDMVISLDRDGIIQSANSGVRSIYGYEPEELVGFSREVLISPKRREIIDHNISKVDLGLPRQFDTIAPHRDGYDVPVGVTLIPIWASEQVVGHWAIVRDMTRMVEAQDELRRIKTSLEEAQRISNVGSFEWDATTGELEWSAELYRILGVSPDTFSATFDNLLAFIYPVDREPLLSAMDHTMTTHDTFKMELRLTRSDGGNRVINCLGEVVQNSSGNAIGMVGTALDITERKREEEALQHLLSMLEEKTEALEMTASEQESFIYSVSHDLRSPLISIQGMTEIVQTDYADQLDDVGRQYLHRISVNVRRLQDMLNGLLELSRIGRTEKGSRREVNVHSLVAEIMDGLKDAHVERDPELIIEGELPPVQAHYSRMSQLFTNLLDNAISYTAADRRPCVIVRAEPVQNGWRFSVVDNGVGIPQSQQRAALNMFSRLPEGQRMNPGGSGLGLAIASRIVTSHGGRLTLDSTEGEGTTISFTII